MSASLVYEESSREHGVRGSSGVTGMTGERRWLVQLEDTFDYLEAFTVVPQPPAPWSAAFPDLRLRQIDIEEIIAAPNSSQGGHVYARVRVRGQYSTPDVWSGGGGAIPPEDRVPGAAFGQWEFQESSRVVRTDTAGAALINEDGASVLDTAMEVRVIAFRQAPPTLSVLLPLLRPPKTNSNAITFPAIWGTTQTFEVTPGQAIFVSPRTTIEQTGVCRMEYRFLVAQDWKERAQKRDANGAAVGPIIAQDIYESVNIPTTQLWGS